jgi:tetratricopeptide (TPR) repeat protein
LALGLCGGVFAAGLPGEYLVTQRWRALHNQFSPLSNPANIAEENYIAVRAAIAPVLQGEFVLSEFGVNVPLSLYQTASFAMLIENAGVVYNDVPDPSTGRLVPSSLALGNTNVMFSFGYAWHVWEKLIIGANLNFAYQSNFENDPLMGTGIDIGANYRLMKHPVLGEHIVGLATQNLIAPTMGASFIPDMESTTGYARNLRFSGYSKFWESRVENYLEFDLKDIGAAKDNFIQNDGTTTDFLKQLELEMNWRVGYWAMRMFKAYMLFGFDDNILGHWGIALGAQLPSFNKGRDMSIYYQYDIMTEENSDASAHSFYVKADFGKHREEVYARKMARMASLNPNELYNRARKLHAEKKYWEAFFIFSRLATEFPDFFKNDWVMLLRTDCQEQLDMRDQGLVGYGKVKEAYPTGEVAPFADLGLMRIYYRNGNFGEATNQFVELNKPSVPDSLRFHGSYIMGQIFLQNGEFRKAIHAFSLIPEGHPDYVFAQHATAIAHASLDSDMKDVITALENVMSVSPKNQEEQETVNRSYLFMGLIFYEENALSKAVVALRQVPANSHYYEDALLGLGWTALKARQWNDCIATGQLLTKTTQKPVLRAEGLLIQAYGHLLQKDYPRALELIKAGYDISQGLEAPNPDSLTMRNTANDNSRLEYSRMSDRVDELSQMGQTSHLSGVLDSLKGKSTDYIKEFRDNDRFKYEYGRGSFFSRGNDQVKEDLEYALATVQKIVGAAGAIRQQQKSAGQTQQLDAEIEKLKKQMEEMEDDSGGGGE